MRIQSTEDLKEALRWLQDNWMLYDADEQAELGEIIAGLAACATPSADELKRLHAAVLDAGEDQPPSGQRALATAADKLLSAALRLHRKCERKGDQVDAQVSNANVLQASNDSLQRELAAVRARVADMDETLTTQRTELALLRTQLQEAKQLGEMAIQEGETHRHIADELRVSLADRDKSLAQLRGTMEDLVNERDAEISRLRSQRG